MARPPERPSIMDSPAMQRAVFGAGALLAAVGAALFLVKRKKSEASEPKVSDGPKGPRSPRRDNQRDRP